MVLQGAESDDQPGRAALDDTKIAFGPCRTPGQETEFVCVCGLFRFDREELLRTTFATLPGFVREFRRGHAAILQFSSAAAAARNKDTLQNLRSRDRREGDIICDARLFQAAASSISSSSRGAASEDVDSVSSSSTRPGSSEASPIISPDGGGRDTREPELTTPSTRQKQDEPTFYSSNYYTRLTDHDHTTAVKIQEDPCSRPLFNKVSFCALVANPKPAKSVRNSEPTRPPHGAYTWATLPAEKRPIGLSLEEDFVSEAEEAALVEWLSARSWDTTLKRRVQHFGMRFDYLSLHPEQVDDANKGENSIPFELSLSSRFSFPGQYNQVTVNEYPAGVGIAPHVETHSCFEEGFCSVSLLGGIVMDFRRRKDTFGLDERQMANVETLPNNAEEEVVSLYLPPRSRVTFHGEARFAWRHGIASRTSDMVNGVVIPERQYRISLTYRKVKSIPFCDCPYVWLCNHQNPGSMQLPKRKLAAAALARQAADEV